MSGRIILLDMLGHCTIWKAITKTLFFPVNKDLVFPCKYLLSKSTDGEAEPTGPVSNKRVNRLLNKESEAFCSA